MMIGFTVPPPPEDEREGGKERPAAGRRRFDAALLEYLASAPSVEVETRRSPAAPASAASRTAIPVVVDDEGRIYTRPREGAATYWYRRILINPGVTLHTGLGPIYVRAVPLTDERTAALVAELYERKYGPDERDSPYATGGSSDHATVRFELF